MDLITDHRGLLHRTELLDLGGTDTQIASLIRDRTLATVAPGIYVLTAAIPAGSGPERADHRYRLRCLTAGDAESRPVLAYQSAAAVHGIKLLKPDRTRVHVINGRPDGGTVHPARHIHAAPFDDDVVVVDGVAVTGLVRTAVDVALTAASFAQALTVFDSVLRLGVARDALAEVLDRRRRRGARRARVALAHADGAAESVGESWSRAQMIQASLPAPGLQTRFLIEGGVARTDFDWEGRVVGEFDGLLKYGRDLRPGETERDPLIREKLREERLRDLGLIIVRWIWADLERDRAIPRIRRALAAHGLLA